MPPIRSYIARHCPLLTPRIEFDLKARPPLPKITPRRFFAMNAPRYRQPASGSEEESDSGEESDASVDNAAHTVASSAPLDVQTAPVAQTVRRRERSRSATPAAGPSSSKIPKPIGEPGRPNSGGFSLEQRLIELGWSKGDVEKFNSYLRVQAGKYLDSNLSYRYQAKDCIDKICERATEPHNFPQLSNYQDCWPVHGALKLILKSAAESSRRTEGKNMTARMRELVQNQKRQPSQPLP